MQAANVKPAQEVDCLDDEESLSGDTSLDSVDPIWDDGPDSLHCLLRSLGSCKKNVGSMEGKAPVSTHVLLVTGVFPIHILQTYFE